MDWWLIALVGFCAFLFIKTMELEAEVDKASARIKKELKYEMVVTIREALTQHIDHDHERRGQP